MRPLGGWIALAGVFIIAGCTCSVPIGVRNSEAGNLDEGLTEASRRDECGNGLDDDRNGRIDDGCPCAPQETQSCFSGDDSSRRVGACADGIQRCSVSGTEFGDWGDYSCSNDVRPTIEICDGVDRDCDGAIDEGCSCDSSESRECGAGFLEAPCRRGVQTCVAGMWGACEGAIGPSSEVCTDDIDNDCDGLINEGCGCVPEPEECDDGVDNDCDGVLDEPACTPDWTPDMGCASATCEASPAWTRPLVPSTTWVTSDGTSLGASGVAVAPDGRTFILTPFVGSIDAGCGVVVSESDPEPSVLLHARARDGSCLWQRVVRGPAWPVRRFGPSMMIQPLSSGDFVVVYNRSEGEFGHPDRVVVRHRGADGSTVWMRRLWDEALTNSETFYDLVIGPGDAIFLSFVFRTEAPTLVLESRTIEEGRFVTAFARLAPGDGSLEWLSAADHNPYGPGHAAALRLITDCSHGLIFATYADGPSSETLAIPERRAELESAPVWDLPGYGGFLPTQIARNGGGSSDAGAALVVGRLDIDTGLYRSMSVAFDAAAYAPTPIVRPDGSLIIAYLSREGGTGEMRLQHIDAEGRLGVKTPAPFLFGAIDFAQIVALPDGYAVPTMVAGSNNPGELQVFRFDDVTPRERIPFRPRLDWTFYRGACGSVFLSGRAASEVFVRGVVTAIDPEAPRFTAQLR